MNPIEISFVEWLLIMIAPPLTVAAALAAVFWWGAKSRLTMKE